MAMEQLGWHRPQSSRQVRPVWCKLAATIFSTQSPEARAPMEICPARLWVRRRPAVGHRSGWSKQPPATECLEAMAPDR